MKKRCSLLAAIATGLTLGISTITPVRASSFTFQENPALIPQPDPATVIPAGNTLTILNADTVQNVSDQPTPDSIYIFPFLYANVDNAFIGLEWENSLDAYTNSNYDGLGNRLILSLTNISDRIRLGDLADVTGTAPLPLMLPCDNSPSCPTDPPPFPLPAVSQDSDDEVPFIPLGSFAPGERKSFDVVFDFAYEDNRTGPLRLFPTFSILSATASATDPAPAAIPEPTGAIALAAISSLYLRLKPKTQSKRTAQKHSQNA